MRNPNSRSKADNHPSPKKALARALVIIGFLPAILFLWLEAFAAHGERKFPGLKTDTAKSLIDLHQVRSGGPGKDGIPALDAPRFVEQSRAKLPADTRGVLVEVGEERRFYPINILVWHEIVNDKVGDRAVAVTFCPLCGSAIVFDRKVGGKTLRFGVSGLLFESNLLMYDDRTESLWSQARGQAVVGELAGTKLEIVDAQLLRFDRLREHYPDARVMSDRTGHQRDYSRYPYGDYDRNERLHFPVSVQDARYPRKMMLYVVPAGGKSAAFPLERLREQGRASMAVGGRSLEVLAEEHLLTARLDGAKVPGYYEMWFSWAVHHQKDGVVWKPSP